MKRRLILVSYFLGATVITAPIQPTGCASISYGVQTDYGTVTKTVGGGFNVTADLRQGHGLRQGKEGK